MGADLVLLGGTVCPVASAPIADGGVAIAGDRIVAVGSAADVEALVGFETRVVRLPEDRTVVPGFNDSHQHLQGYVEAAEQVQVWHARTVGELTDLVAEAALERAPGEWIVAAGHDEGRLAERRHPTLAELDRAAPHNPVLVRRTCSHLGVVNSRALELAGYDDATPDPPGGRLERRDGRLTGVLHEAAQRAVKALVPRPQIDWPEALRRAACEYHRRGITSIAEASAGNRRVEDAELLVRAVRDGDLPLRVYLMARGAYAAQLLAEDGPVTGDGDEWVRLGPIKLMADGVIGAGTAFLSADYADEPGSRGTPALPEDELREAVAGAHRKGFQVAVHAIGDAAVELVVDAVERAVAAAPRADHRHRIEHVEVCPPDLAARLARAGVIASVQSLFTHWSFAGDADVARLPESLAASAHPWGGLARAGVRLCDGSDNPVVPDFAPLLGLHAATTRRTHDGGTVTPEHALTIHEALAAYTRGGAVASFEEGLKGTLEPGKLADLAVVSGDLLGDPDALPELEVELTAVGGRIVHDLVGSAA